MARKVKDKTLDTREARGKLKPRGKPYWRSIERGLHLGYRRLAGKPGTWCTRHYIGDQQYEVEALGIADDQSDADGRAILDFWQAQTKARDRMTQRAGGARRGPITVRDVVEQYLEWMETNRRSAPDAKYRAEAFIYPGLGDINCEKLTADMIRKWHVGLAKAPPRKRTSPEEKQQYRDFDSSDEAVRKRRSSTNCVLVILKAALNRAWRDGKLPSNEEWKKVQPFQGVDVARIRYLTIAEAQRLINSCDPDFRPLVQAALQTGARYGELVRLTVSDFHVGKQRDKDGNPVEVGTVAIRQSKSGKPRHIVLTDEGMALFRHLSAGKNSGDLILRRHDGLPFGPSHQARPMLEACKHAKIKPTISFHGLRHTWASLSVMAGMPLVVVAKNLGHVDTRMVEKHYGHLAPSFIADAIRANAPRFGFKPDPKIASL